MNYAGSQAQIRSAQFNKEVEQYAKNAYPLPERQTAGGSDNNKTGYGEVSLDVNPYERSKDNLKPVDDVSR